MEDLFDRCLQSHNNTTSDALCNPFKDCLPETDLFPEDSVSQVASCQGAMSTTSSILLARQIDLDRRRAELRAIHARDLATAKADADVLIVLIVLKSILPNIVSAASSKLLVVLSNYFLMYVFS